MTDHTLSSDFIALFREHSGPTGELSFARFMELALYHPRIGYYTANRPRVGYGSGTDFFTASTSGPLFGELIVAACASLLGKCDLGEVTFVEIGAEPKNSVLTAVSHPFGRTRTLRLGEPLEITGRCVVFSNELFDSQPFRRFTFRQGVWRELGVALRDRTLQEIELPPAAPPLALPADAGEGYIIDLPLAAADLAAQIGQQPWTGVFVACDYGKTWQELSEHCPAGTARAYYRHTQSNRLLDRPGQQDLTCHVCWDWLADALERHGFASPGLDSQEAFFVKHAAEFIATTTAAEAARFSQKKLGLLQLLHPGNLGQKFQVLHATRF